ncbi:MAG: toll/interleukin-1 receptor domain-containing protein, partial [Mycobacterium sp.]
MGGSDKTTQVVRIFQSYGWRDAGDIAQRLKDSLTEAGYQVWLDHEQLGADDKYFSVALEKAITDCDVVVALLSPHSVRGLAEEDERSSICYNELLFADKLARPIVPVKVGKYVGPPPFLIIKYRMVDWLDWPVPDAYRRGLHEITTLIEHVLGKGTLFDPDIAFQVTKFGAKLDTAAETFTGRQWLFDTLEDWLAGTSPCFLIEGDPG